MMGWGVPDGWIEPAANAGNRCLVHGVWRSPDGGGVRRTFTLVPARSGIWQGEVIASDAITVTPGDDGSFAVPLVPSSAVGRYRIEMGDLRFVIEVPDRPGAELLEIQVKEEQGG